MIATLNDRLPLRFPIWPLRCVVPIFAAALLFLLPAAVRASTTDGWNASGGGSWFTTGDWSLAAVPTAISDATFNTGTSQAETITFNAVGTVDGLVFTNTGTTTLDSSSTTAETLTLANDGIKLNSGAGNVTIGNAADPLNLSLSTSQSWTNSTTASSLTIVNGISTTTASTLTLANSSTGGILASGVISGTLTLSVSGGVTFQGANTYSGGTTITGGYLQLNGSTAATAGTGMITIDSGAEFLLGSAATVANQISGLGYVQNFNGTATSVTLSGLLNYTGNTYFTTANSTFNFAPSSATADTLSGNIGLTSGGSGTTVAGGNVIMSGAGTLKLGGANAYTGTTTVTNGTLQATETTGTPFGTGPVTLNYGTLSLAPSGSGTAVSLSGASAAVGTQFLYSGGGTLSLNRGTQSSLTYTIGNASATAVILARSGTGTLVINSLDSSSNLSALGNGLADQFLLNSTAAGAIPVLSNGIVNATIVGQSANGQGDFLTTYTNGSTTGFSIAAYDTNFAAGTPSSTTVEDITIPQSSLSSTSVFALRAGASIALAPGATLSIGNYATTATATQSPQAGLILDGGLISGGSALTFGSAEGLIYTATGGGTISTPITSGAVTTFGPGALTLAGGLSGTASLTVDNTTILPTFSTYSGGTIVTTGLLQVGVSSTTTGAGPNLAITGTVTGTGLLTVNGGTVDLSTFNLAVNGLAGSGGTIASSNTSASTLGSLTILTGTTSHTYSGTIANTTGSGSKTVSVTVDGTGTQVFSGTNTYTGGLLVNGAMVQYTAEGNLGGGTIALANGGTINQTNSGAGLTTARTYSIGVGGGTFNFAGTGNGTGSKITFASTLTGTGALTTTGGADMYITGTASGFTGAWNINGGLVEVATGSFATGPITINAGQLINNSRTIANILNLNSGSVVSADGTNVTNAFSGQIFVGGTTTLLPAQFYQASSAVTITISGAVSGTGSMTETLYDPGFGNSVGTAGKVILSGANTFTGNTTVSIGANNDVPVLDLSNSVALQDSTVTSGGSGIVFDSTVAANAFTLGGFSGTTNLAIQNSAAAAIALTVGSTLDNTSNTYSGILSGVTGSSLTKAGAGTWTLTGANTYTGLTVIKSGTLQIGNGTIGSLNYAGTTPGTSLTFTGTGTINFDEAGGSSQAMGTLTAAVGDGTVQSTYSGTTTTTMLTFRSLSTRATGATTNFVVSGGAAGTPGSPGTLGTNNIVLNGQAAGFISPGTFYDGGTAGATYAYYDAAGFVRGVSYGTDANSTNITASVAILPAGSYDEVSGSGAVTLQTNAAITTLQLTNANNFTLDAGDTLTLSGILKSGGAAGGVISGGLGIQPPSGSELVVRTDQSADILTIDSPILANGADVVTKSGAGSLTLSALNTYSGGTYLNAGTLDISNGGSATASAIGTGPLVINGGTIDNATTGPLTLATNNLQTWNGSFTYGGKQSLNLGAGAVTITGNGAVPTTVAITAGAANSGTTLTIGGKISPASAVTVADTLAVNGPGNVTLAGIIANGSGAGNSLGLTMNGTGVLTLGNANTFTGSLTINDGTVAYTADNNLGAAAAPIILNGGTLDQTSPTAGFETSTTRPYTIGPNGGTLNFAGSVPWTGSKVQFGANQISGAGPLTKTGLGNIWITAAQSFTGPLYIDGGFIETTNASGLGSGTVTINSGGELVDSDGVTIANNIVINSGGVLSVDNTGTGTYTGSVTINGSVTMIPADFYASNAGRLMAVSGPISGSGGITVTTINGGYSATTPGTLTLSGPNTYSGGTVVNAGTLTVSGSGTLGATTGTLQVNNLNTGTGTNVTLNLSATAATTTGSLSGTIATPSSGANIATIITGANETFTVNQTTPGSFAGVIGGTGSFTLGSLSTGPLTLAGANTYSGGTTVNAGTLIMTNPANAFAAGGLTVASGAAFIYQPSAAGGLNFPGALTLAGAGSTIGTGLAGTTSQSAITVGGNASLSGNVTVNIYGIPGTDPTAGSNNLISAPTATGSGLAGASSYTFNVYNATDFTVSGYSETATAISANVTTGLGIQASEYWVGGFSGGNNVWAISDGSANSNWVTDPSGLPAFATSLTPGPGTTINFSAAGAADEGSMFLGANMSIQGIVVNDTNPVGLNNDGNTLTLGSAGITVNSGAGAIALSPAIVLSAPQTWTNNGSNTLSVGSSATSVNNGANLLTIAGSGATTITNFNGGTGGLTVSNSSGASNPTVTLNGTIALNGAQTWTNNSGNTLSASGAVATNGSLLTTAGAGNVAISGNISGTGGLSASGTMLTLSGSNTYTGTTTVSAGLVVASSTSALGYGGVTLSGGTLRVTAPTGATTISGFGGNNSSFGSSGTANGWTVTSTVITSNAFPTTNVLQLTDNSATNQARDAFYTTPVQVSNGFTATFTFTPSGNKAADGATFILQDDPRGASAYGGAGGTLGFTGVANSVGAELNIYSGATGGIGIPATLATNGAIPGNVPVTPVSLGGGDPINVTLIYNPSATTLTEILTDPTANTTFSKVYSGANLPATLGSNTAHVGFSGSDGGSLSTQQISNFTYTTTPIAATYANSLSLTGGAVSTIDVAANSANPTITMGTLAVGNGTGTQFNVTGSTVPANQSYGLTLGATTLAGNVTINIANNTNGGGNALGTLTLGAVGQTGGTWGITTIGPGTLVLGSTNTYTGPTTVLSGTLLVNGSLAGGATTGAVVVGGSGAAGTPTLGGSGTINGAVTINGPGTGLAGSGVAGILAPGAGGTPSLLTIANSLTLSTGSTLNFILSPSLSGNNDEVVMTGNNLLTIGSSGTLDITALGTLSVGNYVLVSNTGGTISGGGGWTVGTVTGDAGHTYSVGAIGTNFDLTIVAPTITWTNAGTTSGAWDFTTQNWATTTGTPQPTVYSDGSNVQFTDTNSLGTPALAPLQTVNITSAVYPASVDFQNNSTQYTVNGTIAGVGNVSLDGSATVTLTGASSSYSGGTFINQGTLLIGASSTSSGSSLVSGPVGTGAITLGATASSLNNASLYLSGTGGGLSLGNNIIVASGSSGTMTLGAQNTSGIDTISGTITLGSGSTGQNLTISEPSGGELDLTGAFLNGGTPAGITINGGDINGIVKLTSGASTYAGATTVNSGTLRVTNAGGSATGTGQVNVSSGAVLGGGAGGITGMIGGLVVVSGGGHLAPNGFTGTSSTGMPTTLTLNGGLTLSDSAVLDYVLGTTSDLVTLGGTGNTLTLGGGLALNITPASGFAVGTTYDLINYGSAATVAPGSDANLGSWTDPSAGMYQKASFTDNTTAQQIQFVLNQITASAAWNSTASTGNWSDLTTWSIATYPNDAGQTATFGAGTTNAINSTTVPGGTITVTNDINPTLGTLTFDNAAVSYTLTGGTVTMNNNNAGENGAFVNVNSGSHTIASNLVLADAGGTTFNVASNSGLTVSGSITNSSTAGATFAVGSGGSLVLSGGVNNGGNLVTIGGAGTATVSTTGISGGGGLTYNGTGSGTLTLSAANSYTGPTNVNGGMLRIASGGSLASGSSVSVNSGGTLSGPGAIGGPVAVAGGGILAPSGVAGQATQMNLTGGLTLSSGSLLNFNITNSSSDLINVTGDLTLGTGSLSIYSGGGLLNTGDYPLIDDYNGSVINDISAPWTVSSAGDDGASGHIYSFMIVPSTGMGVPNQFDLVVSSGSNSGYWTSNGTGSNPTDFATGANWSSGAYPNGAGQIATFGTGSQMMVSVSGAYTIGQLNFNNSIATASSNYMLTGTGSLTLNNSGSGANIDVTGNVNPTINTTLTLADSSLTTTLNVAAGSSLDLGGAVNESSPAGQQIVLTGGGIVTMEGTGGYTGGTTIVNGTLIANSSGALNSGSVTFNPAPSNTATLNVNADLSINNLSETANSNQGAAQLNIASSTTLTVNQTASANITAALTVGDSNGAGGLVLNQGSGNTLTISGSPTFTYGSTITVNSGTLALTNNTGSAGMVVSGGISTVAPSVSVASGATLQLAGNTSVFPTNTANTVNVTTHGTGASNDGTLTIVGTTNQTVGVISGDTMSPDSVTTTYSGNTTVGDGTNAANLTATQILQNTLTINAGSTVTIAPSGPGIASGVSIASAIGGDSVAPEETRSDSSSAADEDPLTAIQAAIASGAISVVKGEQLENRIAAIERLAATDPGLDASLLEDRVLSALPSPSVWSSRGSAPAIESGSGLLAVDNGVSSSSSGSTLGSANAAFAPTTDFGAGPAAVPEPSTLLLAAIAGIGILVAARRRSGLNRGYK